MKNPILVFDFDGTIADTHAYIIEISNRLSSEFNYNIIHPDEIDQLKNKTSQEIIRHLNVPVMKIPAILTKAKKEFHQHIACVKPIPGLTDILYRLKELKIRMGILSSNTPENIHKFLKNHRLDIFDFVSTTSKIWTKNTSLKILIDHEKLPKNLVIYIGDEIRDITAAKKLGLKVAAVGWGYNSTKSLKKHEPDFLIESPVQLLALLKQSAA